MERAKAEALLDQEPEVLEPLQLHFSDLVLLSSAAPPSPSPSPDELARLESISATVIKSLGPSGPGLLSVTGVPRASALRRALLPLARQLALLGHEDRARVLKEHGLGSDVPLKNLDRTVSSFALQLKYAQDLSLDSSLGRVMNTMKTHDAAEHSVFNSSEELDDDKFDKLGITFNTLGLCMIELGLRLAHICDKALGCNELEQSIMESGSAKGRLIHYHSTVDNLNLKETNRRNKGPRQKVTPATFQPSSTERCTGSQNFLSKSEFGTLYELASLPNAHLVNSSAKDRISRTSSSSLWQEWHYDYGIFTILTSPSFMLTCQREDCCHISCCKECASPDDHTYLQLFNVVENKILVVRSPPDSFIIQVGESADILSRGRLRSTLHSVGRPLEVENLSRETFVVFLQPAWTKILTYSGCSLNCEINSHEKMPSVESVTSCSRDTGFISRIPCSQVSDHFLQEVLTKIPPLSTRFKEGMTFAEFSHETTKQYYGGRGTQSLK